MKIKNFLLFITVVIFSFGNLSSEEGIKNPPAIHDEICSTSTCYTLIQELGEGAFGKVFSAKDSQGQLFAIKWYKEVSQDYGVFWTTLADVEREFENGQRLNHAHIIHSKELFKGTGEEYYLVLELVQGKTVYKTARKSLPFEESLTYARQLIDTLSYAESQGFLFWDLHGNNVMLEDISGLKMIDLASFFSWEEVLSIPLVNRPHFNPKMIAKGIEAARPFRLEKLEKIFKEDPVLNKAIQEHTKKRSLNQEDRRYINLIYAVYFNRISDLCVEIIKKGTTNVEHKVDRIAAIKYLAWTFLEKAQDGVVDRNFADYMKDLEEVLSQK